MSGRPSPTAAPALVARQQTLAHKQIGKIHEQKVTRRLVTVTPTYAAHILERNPTNRSLRQDHIDKMARDMKNGKWCLETAPTVKFLKNGELRDGQHRLYACLMADVPVQMEFAEGLTEDMVHTIDVGRARSFQDVLKIQGRSDIAELATSARWWYNYMKNGISFARSVSHSELLDLLDKYPQIEPFVAEGNKYKRARNLLGPGLWGFVFSGAAMVDSDRAKLFAEAFDSGQDLKKGNPALTLRERMATNRAAKAKLRQPMMAAFAIKAWNSYLTGRSLTVLRWQDGEEFPRFAKLNLS
jgi:hypothetical protein